MTLRFCVGGVDVARVEQTLKEWGYRFGGDHFPMEFYSLWREESFNPFTKLLREGVKEGALTERDGSYVQIYYHPTLGKDVLWFNCPEAGHILDAVSARSVTEMVLYSRKSAVRILTFLKRRFPGFEHSYLQTFSSIPGIRESRRLVGEYVLTEEDIRARRRFDDCVAQTAYPVDIHNEHNLVLIHLEPGEYYEIPYRCLVTRELDNLLVAGRCSSATFAAQSSMRIQLVCMALGEAAGIAAGAESWRCVWWMGRRCAGACRRTGLCLPGGNVLHRLSVLTAHKGRGNGRCTITSAERSRCLRGLSAPLESLQRF